VLSTFNFSKTVCQISLKFPKFFFGYKIVLTREFHPLQDCLKVFLPLKASLRSYKVKSCGLQYFILYYFIHCVQSVKSQLNQMGRPVYCCVIRFCSCRATRWPKKVQTKSVWFPRYLRLKLNLARWRKWRPCVQSVKSHLNQMGHPVYYCVVRFCSCRATRWLKKVQTKSVWFLRYLRLKLNFARWKKWRHGVQNVKSHLNQMGRPVYCCVIRFCSCKATRWPKKVSTKVSGFWDIWG